MLPSIPEVGWYTPVPTINISNLNVPLSMLQGINNMCDVQERICTRLLQLVKVQEVQRLINAIYSFWCCYKITIPVLVSFITILHSCTCSSIMSAEEYYMFAEIACEKFEMESTIGLYYSMKSNKVGGVVNFWCDKGMLLSANQSLTCGNSGTWNGTIPSCQGAFYDQFH